MKTLRFTLAALVLFLSSTAHAACNLVAMEVTNIKGFSVTPSQCVYDQVLGASGTAESVAVPAGAGTVVFSGTDVFYATFSGTETAAVPASDTAGGGSVLNPQVRSLTGVPNISLVAPSAGTIVSLEFFK